MQQRFRSRLGEARWKKDIIVKVRRLILAKRHAPARVASCRRTALHLNVRDSERHLRWCEMTDDDDGRQRNG